MTNHSVVKRGVRVRKKREMSKRGAADCDVLKGEMTQWRRESGGKITERERNRKEKRDDYVEGLKKSEIKKFQDETEKRNQRETDRQADREVYLGGGWLL